MRRALYLYRYLLKLVLKVGGACHKCGRKGNSWTYRSSCKKYNLHVSCVMEMLLDSWHDIYFGGGGHGSNGTMTKGFMGNNTKIPCIRGAKINHHRSKGKVKRCCELAGLALQFIISAVLGDPTAVIAGVIGSFIPRV